MQDQNIDGRYIYNKKNVIPHFGNHKLPKFKCAQVLVSRLSNMNAPLLALNQDKPQVLPRYERIPRTAIRKFNFSKVKNKGLSLIKEIDSHTCIDESIQFH